LSVTLTTLKEKQNSAASQAVALIRSIYYILFLLPLS